MSEPYPYTLEVIPLDQITKSDIAIREVDVNDEKTMGIVESMKEVGVLDPIGVRTELNLETNETVFVLVDGAHRKTCAGIAGLQEIKVKNYGAITREEGLVIQFHNNYHRKPMSPAEEGRQFDRLIKESNGIITAPLLAKKMGVSVDFVEQRINIHKKLCPAAKQLVDEGSITLQNAKALCALPAELQADYLQEAVQQDTKEFGPFATKLANEAKKKIASGESPKVDKYTPVFHFRKITDVKAEIENPAVAMKYCSSSEAMEAFKLALLWVGSLDSETVAQGQAAWDAKKEETARKKELKAKQKEQESK